MPTKKSSTPRFNVQRTPRTEDEKSLLRELKELRSVPGVLYTGSRVKDGQTRYVVQVDEATARRLLSVLGGGTGKAKPAPRKKASGQRAGSEAAPALTPPPGKGITAAKKASTRSKAAL